MSALAATPRPGGAGLAAPREGATPARAATAIRLAALAGLGVFAAVRWAGLVEPAATLLSPERAGEGAVGTAGTAGATGAVAGAASPRLARSASPSRTTLSTYDDDWL